VRPVAGVPPLAQAPTRPSAPPSIAALSPAAAAQRPAVPQVPAAARPGAPVPSIAPAVSPIAARAPATGMPRAHLPATPPSLFASGSPPPPVQAQRPAPSAGLLQPAHAPRTPPPALAPAVRVVGAPASAPTRPPLLDDEPVTSVGVPVARPTAARPVVKAPAPAPAAVRGGTELPEGLDMAQLQDLSERASALNRMDYFELLRLPQSASPAEIKQAFYRESRSFHPDRFFQVSNPTLKAHVHELYKRLAEGYGVLRDDRRRRQYLADIQGPDRARKLRYTEASEAETKAAEKRQSEEQIGSTPRGRQFFLTAQSDESAGRLPSAERNLKMALTFEPQNERYKERLRAVQDAIEAERRSRI